MLRTPSRNFSAFAKRVLAIEPTNFYLNKEAAADNSFMQEHHLSGKDLHNKVVEEHRGFVKTLKDAGIGVSLYQ